MHVTDKNKLEEYAADADVNTASSLMAKTQWEDGVSIRYYKRCDPINAQQYANSHNNKHGKHILCRAFGSLIGSFWPSTSCELMPQGVWGSYFMVFTKLPHFSFQESWSYWLYEEKTFDWNRFIFCFTQPTLMEWIRVL